MQRCFFLYAGIPPLKCMKVSLVLVKDQRRSNIGQALFQGQKVRLFLSFVIDAAPSFHWILLDSHWLYCEAGSFQTNECMIATSCSCSSLCH